MTKVGSCPISGAGRMEGSVSLQDVRAAYHAYEGTKTSKLTYLTTSRKGG
ncbi:MAG TPA: hypothetical protein VF898_02815 [Chloroflexota bacterium]